MRRILCTTVCLLICTNVSFSLHIPSSNAREGNQHTVVRGTQANDDTIHNADRTINNQQNTSFQYRQQQQQQQQQRRQIHQQQMQQQHDHHTMLQSDVSPNDNSMTGNNRGNAKFENHGQHVMGLSNKANNNNNSNNNDNTKNNHHITDILINNNNINNQHNNNNHNNNNLNNNVHTIDEHQQQPQHHSPFFSDSIRNYYGYEDPQFQQKYNTPRYQSDRIDESSRILPIKYQLPMPMTPSHHGTTHNRSPYYSRQYDSSRSNYNRLYTNYEAQKYLANGSPPASGFYSLYFPGQHKQYSYHNQNTLHQKEQHQSKQQRYYDHSYEAMNKPSSGRYPHIDSQHRLVNSAYLNDLYDTHNNNDIHDLHVPQTTDNVFATQHALPHIPNAFSEQSQHINNTSQHTAMTYYTLDTCEYRFILDMVQCHESSELIKSSNTDTKSHVHHGEFTSRTSSENSKHESRYKVDSSHGFVPSFGHPFYAPGLDNHWFSKFYSSFRAASVKTYEQTQSRSYLRYGDFTSASTDFQRMHLTEVKQMTSSIQVMSNSGNNWSGVSPLFGYRVYLLHNGCVVNGHHGSHPCIVFKGATHPYKEVSRVFVYVRRTTHTSVHAETTRHRSQVEDYGKF